jgi:hypothetical protein
MITSRLNIFDIFKGTRTTLKFKKLKATWPGVTLNLLPGLALAPA